VKVWIGAALAAAVVVALVLHGNTLSAGLVGLVSALALLGNRTRRGNTEPWKLSGARDGGRAERNATGATVTGGINDSGAGLGGF
jgi:hypothetical protein